MCSHEYEYAFIVLPSEGNLGGYGTSLATHRKRFFFFICSSLSTKTTTDDVSDVNVDNSTLPLFNCFRCARMSTWSLNFCIGTRLAFDSHTIPFRIRCFSFNIKIHFFPPLFSSPLLYRNAHLVFQFSIRF